MPLLSTFAGAAARAWKTASVFVVNAITDSFNRANNSSSLGTADSGQTWTNTKGTWGTSSNQASSSDAGSNYSIATAPFKTAGTISATVTEGTGVAWWVSSSGSWFATVPYHTSVPFSCGCSMCCTSCSNSSCACLTRNSCSDTLPCSACGCATYNSCQTANCGSSYACNDPAYPYRLGATCWDTSSHNGQNSPATTSYLTCPDAACGCATCASCAHAACTCATYDTCVSCSLCTQVSCSCGTCYTDTYYMRMYQSISGTVSTVIADTVLSAAAQSIKVTIVGTTITQTAYSDTALTTSVGTSSTTPSSPTTAPNVGIIKTPANVTQGSIVDNFSAS